MPSRLDYNIVYNQFLGKLVKRLKKNMTKDGRHLIRPEKTMCSADVQYLRKINRESGEPGEASSFTCHLTMVKVLLPFSSHHSWYNWMFIPPARENHSF